MIETTFAAEVDLQKLLARHPGLLPGDQIDPETPRRWLLWRGRWGFRMKGGTRWALDHLFLDQEGVPTLTSSTWTRPSALFLGTGATIPPPSSGSMLEAS